MYYNGGRFPSYKSFTLRLLRRSIFSWVLTTFEINNTDTFHPYSKAASYCYANCLVFISILSTRQYYEGIKFSVFYERKTQANFFKGCRLLYKKRISANTLHHPDILLRYMDMLCCYNYCSNNAFYFGTRSCYISSQCRNGNGPTRY